VSFRPFFFFFFFFVRFTAVRPAFQAIELHSKFIAAAGSWFFPFSGSAGKAPPESGLAGATRQRWTSLVVHGSRYCGVKETRAISRYECEDGLKEEEEEEAESEKASRRDERSKQQTRDARYKKKPSPFPLPPSPSPPPPPPPPRLQSCTSSAPVIVVVVLVKTIPARSLSRPSKAGPAKLISRYPRAASCGARLPKTTPTLPVSERYYSVIILQPALPKAIAHRPPSGFPRKIIRKGASPDSP